MTDYDIHVLRDADPRNDPRFEHVTTDPEALRDRIVGSDPFAPQEPSPHRRRPAIVGFATAAVAVAALAGAFALTAPGRIGPSATPSAYAAVAKAVAKTAEVGSSGTIVTKLTVDAGRVDRRRKPERDLGTTFKWNGDDFDMSGLRRMRYVDGEIYAFGEGVWKRYGPVPADEEPGGVHDWVASAKRAYAHERVGELVKELDDLVQAPRDDGSTVYTGTTTVKVVGETFSDGYYPESNSFVGMTIGDDTDPATPVKVQLTIGADGILSEWTGAYSDQGHDLVFTAKYSDVGSTPAIGKPEKFVEGVRASK